MNDDGRTLPEDTAAARSAEDDCIEAFQGLVRRIRLHAGVAHRMQDQWTLEAMAELYATFTVEMSAPDHGYVTQRLKAAAHKIQGLEHVPIDVVREALVLEARIRELQMILYDPQGDRGDPRVLRDDYLGQVDRERLRTTKADRRLVFAVTKEIMQLPG